LQTSTTDTPLKDHITRLLLALCSASIVASAQTVADDGGEDQPGNLLQLLAPFSSDGCSQFPDGTPRQKTLWLNCCLEHDKAYWLGGTETERQQADMALHACVARLGESDIADIMLAGVRAGGSPYWFTPYRWGYGWPYWDGATPRGYKALTEEERKTATALLATESLAGENPDTEVLNPELLGTETK